MANIASTANPTTAQDASSIKITNLSVPIAGVEISHAFVTGVKAFMIRSRNLARLQIAYTLGGSTTNYVTVGKGNYIKEDGLNFTGKSIYVTSDTVTVLEIQELY